MPDSGGSPDFSAQLIAWQQQHGRHALPWQNTRDPYAIWVSEIMLQQTQVAAVIPYYLRFMARFPDISSLAAADEDGVLQHWSGLGYYSRARNLHAAAQTIVDRHEGNFPQNFDDVVSLPGIGRSTAAAICAFAYGQRHAIMDGNVKRVFARCFGVAGWPGSPAVEKQLWAIAEELLPEHGIEAYTQGLMDLGATLCTRSRPDCAKCPLSGRCLALRDNRVGELPTPKPRKALPERETVMLLLRKDGEILLEKRPPTGIWGGLWSLPEAPSGGDFCSHVRERFGLDVELLKPLVHLAHTFTHFRLHILPQPLKVMGSCSVAQEPGTVWLGLDDAVGAALPTPVRMLISQLK
jgi:A/G-specific adenine glycosylase